MKTWLQLVGLALEAIIVFTFIYFEPTYCVRGKIWGEASFEGRPTSYWRNELSRWNMLVVKTFPDGEERAGFWRQTSVFECLQAQRSPFGDRPLISGPGPNLIHAGPPAEPVLRELSNDPSESVRRAAHYGLRHAIIKPL